MTLSCLTCFVLGALFGFSLGYLRHASALRRGMLFRALDLTDAALCGRMLMVRGIPYLIVRWNTGGKQG